MKILHVPYTYYPDAVGGTEIYVEALARAQQEAGMEPAVAAPGGRQDSYAWGGLRVLRFPVSKTVSDVREMYGEGDAAAAEAFAGILESERPDLVHVHAFTRGVSLRLVRTAKRAGLPVIFSYHTPTVSCQRGTLLKWGSEVCDGTLDVGACSQCTLHGLGMSRVSSTVVGSLPSAIGGLAASAGASGGMWTALRMRELIELRHSTFRSLMAEADHVVALSHWVKELLLRNGVPPEKITVSRQGLWGPGDASMPSGPRIRKSGDSLRMVFLGRLNPGKGAGIVIEALRVSRDIAVQFDIYGIAQGDRDTGYLRELQALADGDARITFCEAVPAAGVVERIRHYDILAVPSQILETGPLVVLEAFAAGVPVVGSNLGGIRETVSDGVDGLLVQPFDSAAAWAEVIRNIANESEVLPRLRRGIRPPREIAACAAEMSAVYRTFARAKACA